MWKIIIGVIFIIGGLSGTMVLRFTNSSDALVAVGVGMLIWGVVEVSRSSRAKARLADAKAREAAEIEEVLRSPIMQDERIKSFYRTTLDAWSTGKLASLGPAFAADGRMPYEGFLRKHSPKRGGALGVFFEKYPPRDGEFLVGWGDLGTAETIGWFVLTNLRLVQRDGKDNQFKEVVLGGVDTYRKEGAAQAPKTLVFKMKSGDVMTFENVLMNPKDNYLSEVISLAGREKERAAQWGPDPFGRHEHRYWDGGAWTEHVADQGQAALDPPDP